ncbi:interleukin-19-like [Erpetoichthys calabaricus]|uniref:interleukin-19-like n=1 Tax=Erpetoichthys calabaricus TaxID=27687 RepID=UPI0022343FA4|nr:interleukin-19-like [Erpetoichthys calabaricus]
MSVSLLRRNALNAIQSEESCCFLRQMLGFYLRNVFSHYTSSISMVRRRISSLANGLVSMEKTLSECHRQHICHCKDETRLTIKSFHDSYQQLDNDEAIQKAVSELDILLSWLEMPHH